MSDYGVRTTPARKYQTGTARLWGKTLPRLIGELFGVEPPQSRSLPTPVIAAEDLQNIYTRIKCRGDWSGRVAHGMRLDQQILILHHDPYTLFLLDRAFHYAGIPNPVRICRRRGEAQCFLAGEGAYADREIYPLPDLFILDLDLPDQEAISLLKWIRSNASLKHLPVIGLASGGHFPELQGINSYFRAPDQLDQLALFIKNL